MNFDLGWFTTVPGMFITGGVVLLIIALVILIVTGKKSKKEKKAKEAADANANTAPTMTEPTPVVTPVDASAAVQTSAVANNTNMISPEAVTMANASTVQPMMPEATPTVMPNSMPEVPGVQPSVPTMDMGMPSAPVVDAQPVMSEAPQMSVMPEVQQMPVMDMQVPNAPVVDAQPVMPEAPQMIPQGAPQEHVIYGGADPSAVSSINISQENHQIYGGADPLANTQTIPTIPVANVQPEVVAQEPVIQPIAPVAPTTVEAPVAQVSPFAPVAQVAPVASVAPVAPVQQ